MKIRGANDMVHFQRMGGYRAYIQAQVKQIWGDVAPMIDWHNTQGRLSAYILRSDWVADCPCGDTSIVQPGEPFFCQVCAMQFNDYKPMALDLPDYKVQIVDLLVKRPFPRNRNWLLGETLDDLRRENAEHGIR